MLKNYFKIAWRNLWKNKFTSFINLFGLTISISICLLIALFIHDETHYDTFEKDHAQIYRVEQDFSSNGNGRHWAATPPPLMDFIRSTCPEVESATRIIPQPYLFIKWNDEKLKEEDCFLADSSVFETLGLTLLEGNPKTALSDPDAVVLSEKTAGILFGKKDDINQTILINSTPHKVTGILKDLPSSSHLKINLFCSLKNLEEKNAELFNWVTNGVYTYVKLKKNTSAPLAEKKLGKALYDEGIFPRTMFYYHKFHNISKIHLDGNLEKEISPNSSWLFIYIFITVGILIILLASTNYINLTTSRSLQRAKEIGIRKTLGAFKANLMIQFILESVLITLLSFAVAIIVLFLALPYFNAVTGKLLSLSSLFSSFFLLVSVGIIVFVGLLAGIYPAFVISSFDPVKALKGAPKININKNFSFGFRKSLVTFQFVVSALLVISSIAVIRQISYMYSKPLGFNKENVMVVPVVSLTHEKLNWLRTELKANHGVVNVSATSAAPGRRVYLKAVSFEGREAEVLRTMCIDEDYIKTMGMEMAQGRDFDHNIASDSVAGIILNETAARHFNGLKPMLGEQIILSGPGEFKPGRVIGVVKDFNQGSLHTAIEPMVFHVQTFYNAIVIRYNNEEATKDYIAATWTKLFPDQLFTYNLLDSSLESLYRSEKTLKNLLIIFTLLAIAIASLGLFGLIFFSNTLRKKEISIRKILGAGNRSIIYLLSREYIILIGVSLLISIPLSAYFIHKWLDNFAYRSDISIFTFIAGILITLLIAFATVFAQGLKAAFEKPVKNIKTE